MKCRIIFFWGNILLLYETEEDLCCNLYAWRNLEMSNKKQKIYKHLDVLIGPLSRKKILGYSSISKAPKNRTHMHHISWIIAKSNQPIWPILASKFGQNFQKFSYKNNFCARWRSKKCFWFSILLHNKSFLIKNYDFKST